MNQNRPQQKAVHGTTPNANSRITNLSCHGSRAGKIFVLAGSPLSHYRVPIHPSVEQPAVVCNREQHRISQETNSAVTFPPLTVSPLAPFCLALSALLGVQISPPTVGRIESVTVARCHCRQVKGLSGTITRGSVDCFPFLY